MISSGVSILYSFFTNRKKLAERMPLPMSQLVLEVRRDCAPRLRAEIGPRCRLRRAIPATRSPGGIRSISVRSPSQVSKIEFKPTQSYITFEICCNAVDADDDEDVDVPYVRYKFRNF